jgi:ubiquinone/menaquinone biosynthesis C-methylase UbiE
MNLALLGYDAFMFYFEKFGLDKMRKRIINNVSGKVLELGPGTGINLKYINRGKIQSLTYIDLNYKKGLDIKAKKKCPNITIMDGDVQSLPFEDNTFDSVIFTLVFCSVTNQLKGLSEIKRVLKRGGNIYFIEHVEPSKKFLKYIFNKFNPQWCSITGGCNLNRDTISVLKEAGFDIEIIDKKFKNIFVGGKGRISDTL